VRGRKRFIKEVEMSMAPEPGAGRAPDWRGLAEHEKYDRFSHDTPGGWWDRDGVVGGLHVLNRARVAYFKEKLGSFQGKRMLDVGCGGGILSESLAREGAHVVAVDPSEASLSQAREHARAEDLSIEYRSGFAEALDFNEEFDAVFAVDVLEHVQDLEATLRACARALRPGGFFGFLTHNQTLEAFTFLIWQQEYLQRVMPKGAHDFHKFITPEAMRAALERAGLAPVEIRGLSRAGSGATYVIQVSDDVSVSYLGFATRPAQR
jgi:2-polyprenyl-6-hydroxyphenyl methylase/3-demethylubiquinone-9 3-methyltransferase